MLDANYQKHLKILGKLCYGWDEASADLASQTLTAERFYDQTATGAAGSWVNLQLFNGFTSQWAGALVAGATAIKSLMETMAASYLTSAEFQDDMTTVATTPSSAQSVLEALIAEMGDDSKTLTTAAGTGLVHFFETVWAPDGDLPQSGSPSYADGTYVVQTIV